MSTAVPSQVLLHHDPRVLLLEDAGRHWFTYPSGTSAQATQPGWMRATDLGFLHPPRADVRFTVVDGVRMVGVEMIAGVE